MKIRKLQLLGLCTVSSAIILGAIAQLEMPFLLKEYALVFPLQIAALAYVIWWNNRKSSQDRTESLNPSILEDFKQ
ncbi:MAG: hypothetical protein AAGE59_27980 [Cyanobacteria bacterium P01_F01_bin.86]